MTEGVLTPESTRPPITTKVKVAQREKDFDEQDNELLGNKLTKKDRDKLERSWETKLADLADATQATTATVKLRDVRESWIKHMDNIYLQILGIAADANQAYKDGIHQLLRQRYPNGIIRVYRGNLSVIMTGINPLERDYTNVTTSKKTAKAFAPTNEVSESLPLGVQKSVLIHVEDVVSIGKVKESELIVPCQILKERIANPIQY